jgi:hypothetical protein
MQASTLHRLFGKSDFYRSRSARNRQLIPDSVRRLLLTGTRLQQEFAINEMGLRGTLHGSNREA